MCERKEKMSDLCRVAIEIIEDILKIHFFQYMY